MTTATPLSHGAEAAPGTHAPGDVPIVRMENIYKHFGGVVAINHVSFDLLPGEVLALVGDNGAGKSTLMKVLSGAIRPDSGSIYIRGQKVRIENPQDARRLGIETIYQTLALLNNLDIPANIFMGRELRMGGPLGRLGLMNLRKMRSAAREALENFDIRIGDIDRDVKDFSGGQRQMVTISRALYFQANVLIMDEPTAALGVAETRKVYEFIQTLKRSNIAIIIISHNINEVFQVADRFMVLKTGALVGIKSKEETSIDDIVSMILSGRSRGTGTESVTQTASA
jgi:D-xylose transport system ATP-binding protein